MKIVYSSFYGRYSNHPRAVYERLVLELPDAEHLWLCDERHAHGFPDELVTCPYGSPASIEALEAADLIVANTHLELPWTKSAHTTYLQTWHGTPLKTVHRDLLFAPEGHLDYLDIDIARWDYLVSPSAVTTERLRGAFRYAGKVLEVGYPRNDLLLAPDRDVVRARVRGELGLADDDIAVLYTPTWRDDQFYADGEPKVELPLDLDDFGARLGPRYRLLVRRHYFVAERGAPTDPAQVTDVSWFPDSHELYLAADVMVTDYSSTMFDFAVTGKPLLFYTYDFERYRDDTRGVYFDLTAVAPGPMVTTSAELVVALADLTRIEAAYAEPYAAFRATFGDLEDGHATERVVQALRTAGVLPAAASHRSARAPKV